MSSLSGMRNYSPFRSEPGEVPLPVLLRNSMFDAMFYDTGSLTPEELAFLWNDEDAQLEGGMLVVYPGDENRPVETFASSAKLMETHPNIATVTMAGVGSSVVGTASLARQVADATGQPAVGIISGYGAADVMSEALGGWFRFGVRNRILSTMSAWRQLLGIEFTEEKQAELRDRYKLMSTRFFVDEPESNTLLNILLRSKGGVKLLVGHSKGALNIQNALGAFVEKTSPREGDYEDMSIVTFGCGVDIPDQFDNLWQYVGTWDTLGHVNTPVWELWDPSLHYVPYRCHNLCASTNPLHMPIADYLPIIEQDPRPEESESIV